MVYVGIAIYIDLVQSLSFQVSQNRNETKLIFYLAGTSCANRDQFFNCMKSMETSPEGIYGGG
jgi:hypothetical protein